MSSTEGVGRVRSAITDSTLHLRGPAAPPKPAALRGPAEPGRSASVQSLIRQGFAQRARRTHGGDAGGIVLQDVSQDRFRVLAETRGGLWTGDGAGGLHRGGHLAD